MATIKTVCDILREATLKRAEEAKKVNAVMLNRYKEERKIEIERAIKKMEIIKNKCDYNIKHTLEDIKELAEDRTIYNKNGSVSYFGSVIGFLGEGYITIKKFKLYFDLSLDIRLAAHNINELKDYITVDFVEENTIHTRVIDLATDYIKDNLKDILNESYKYNCEYVCYVQDDSNTEDNYFN